LFEQLETSANKILASTELVSERLAQMFTPENQKTMLGAFSSTTTTTERWTKLADELSPAVQMMPGLVKQADQTLVSVQHLSDNATQLSQNLSGLSTQLQDPNGTLNHSLTAFGDMNTSLQTDTLPKIATLSDDAAKSMRSFNQTVDELKDHPQSLIFGKPAPAPGPGEAGFTEPKR
jgi:phospholipid/cholesterol/gamma-HCH transport system substrate-binding protein